MYPTLAKRTSTLRPFFGAPERRQSTAAASAPPPAAQGGRSRWKKFLGFVLVSGGLVGLALQNNEGLQRSATFWRAVLPIYAHYRAVELMQFYGWISDEYANEYFDSLHTLYSPTVEKYTVMLRGFYLKNAQMMSTRDDFVPPQYLHWCKQMQDQVPAEIPKGEARAIFERSMGRSIDEVFSHWEEEPFAVASIGQVHRATLRDGREVVVKVMAPGIEARFRADLATLRSFCRLAMPHHVPSFNEIEKQFLTEFDYVQEAANLEEIYTHMMPLWAREVAIPRPLTDLCSKEILTMEYLAGVPLVTGIKNQYKRFAELQGKTLEELEHEQKEKIRNGLLQPKTVEEEFAGMRRVALLVKLRDCILSLNPLRFLYNITPFRLFSGPLAYRWTELPINLGWILDLLFRVHAYEIFQAGCFNGDPHPGNILLLPDGRLGLIDYGQVKRLSVEDRILYAKLIIALARDDKDEIVRLAHEELRVKTKYMRKDIAYKLMCFWNDRDTDDITGGLNIQLFMDWAQAQDPAISMYDELIMCARVSVMMRGMANAFNLRVRTAPYWRPNAEQLLRDNGIAY